ncbi:succinyldiaminopimelate transaminase [Gilvimarinus sp. DA14]|uniref:succinyldiaminopimelate transaminase n=1 Tax=Gilvimarinus sp. DA14 TaxID=2956798 RepID=UPI0020B8A27F|nr:succinyldiaminopimelate transaminase [Gilvimarinus sp. DA14]UTF60494.1 succinyldiaminopimelate transaminase [Gilvimarinus sp. DA14]
MNHDLELLHPYPFEKLAQLKAGATPPENLAHIALSIGEPKHEPPAFVLRTLSENLNRLANYPATKGLPELRETIANWAGRRFKLCRALDAQTQVLPVNGTREALFAFAQAVVDRSKSNPLVVSPNPFYQIYEGAALLAGAKPHFLNCTAENNFIPDFNAVDEQVWRDCQLLYICTPGNPTGAVMSTEQFQTLIRLADQYDFVIASDECYSELYRDEQNPPPGLLQAASDMGRTDYARCVVFHSLSKRSNLPGLRSGFVAGDAHILQKFLSYRTYHGCAMPVPSQIASMSAWADEDHVLANRDAYRAKFDAVLDALDGCLDVTMPEAGFYLWPKLPISGEEFARRLFTEQNITVLPGAYLSRQCDGVNPGEHYVRMALVATEAECVEAAHRIRRFVTEL